MVNQKAKRAVILIVEDVEETRDGIEELLKIDDYTVRSARHENEAVTKQGVINPT